MPRPTITATARFFPSRVLGNDYFTGELGLDTSEEWIVARTGIHTRHMADTAGGETTSFMAIEAAKRCLAKAGLTGADLDGILVATVTPDMLFPATACLVQDALGAHRAFAWDTEAACSGYLAVLAQGTAMIRSGFARRILLLGAETMSAILDYTDRNTCVLFGDGAGATLLEASERYTGGEVIDVIVRSDGSGGDLLKQPAGGSALPASEATVRDRLHYVKQEGRQVYKHAVKRIVEVVRELFERTGTEPDDVALFVPHQANLRIIEGAAKRLGVRSERIVVTIDRWANTTAATIPTSLDLAIEEGRLKKGDLVLFATFGAGFTWGAALVRW